MPRAKPRAGILSLLAVAALGILLLGSDHLEARLPGGLPIGNALAAASVILFAWAALLFSASGTALRKLCVLALVLAVLWLPVSIALAGNLDLNFNSSTSGTWFGFTAVVVLASLGTYLLALASSMLRKSRQARAHPDA